MLWKCTYTHKHVQICFSGIFLHFFDSYWKRISQLWLTEILYKLKCLIKKKIMSKFICCIPWCLWMDGKRNMNLDHQTERKVSISLNFSCEENNPVNINCMRFFSMKWALIIMIFALVKCERIPDNVEKCL